MGKRLCVHLIVWMTLVHSNLLSLLRARSSSRRVLKAPTCEAMSKFTFPQTYGETGCFPFLPAAKPTGHRTVWVVLLGVGGGAVWCQPLVELCHNIFPLIIFFGVGFVTPWPDFSLGLDPADLDQIFLCGGIHLSFSFLLLKNNIRGLTQFFVLLFF